jgi:hypothetical protein
MALEADLGQAANIPLLFDQCEEGLGRGWAWVGPGLGPVDILVNRNGHLRQARRPPQPLETEVAAFADVAALFDIAQ